MPSEHCKCNNFIMFSIGFEGIEGAGALQMQRFYDVSIGFEGTGDAGGELSAYGRQGILDWKSSPRNPA